MPGFDRTGPMGFGPMTGGARGLCNPAAAGTMPAYATGYGYGRGMAFRRGRGGGGYGAYGGGRRGRGFGRGYGWNPPAYPAGYTANPTDELDFLKMQADELKNSLNEITKRIDVLTNQTSEDS